MSNPYDQSPGYGQPQGHGGPQDPYHGPDSGTDPYGPYPSHQPAQPYDQPTGQGQPVPYGTNPYAANPYATNPYGTGHAAPPLRTHPLAVASLVTALGGLLGFFCGFLGLAAPVGLVLGIVARKQIKDNPTTQTGEGLALGGIIAGAIISGIMAIFLVLYVAFFGWSMLNY